MTGHIVAGIVAFAWVAIVVAVVRFVHVASQDDGEDQ